MEESSQYSSRGPSPGRTLSADTSNAKRHMACEQCRKRKLKCSGTKPVCASCSRNDRECLYLASFKKSGPKPGHLKNLEKRLEQMETLLVANGINVKNSAVDGTIKTSSSSSIRENSETNPPITGSQLGIDFLDTDDDVHTRDAIRFSILSKHTDSKKSYHNREHVEKALFIPGGSVDLFARINYQTGEIFNGDTDELRNNSQVVPVNVDEAYPSDHISDELINIYFTRIHPMYCLLNKARFYTSLAGGLRTRPRPYLFYAVLLISASVTEKYSALEHEFYTRCVKYIDRAEQNGFGEEVLNLQYIQALVLLCLYEHRAGSFARAWIYTGKVGRAIHMNNIHEIDAPLGARFTGLFSSPKFDPRAKNTAELDEARRVFWIMYILDHYGSVATGWPVTIKDNEVATMVPLDDFRTASNYHTDAPHDLVSLQDLIQNPEKHLRGMRSSTAMSVLLVNTLTRAFNLMTELPQRDDFSRTGYWWTKHNNIKSFIDRLAKVVPAYDMGSPQINSVICQHILIHMCYLSLYRAAFVRLKTLGGPYKPEPFEELCFKATAELTMSLRFSTNLYDVIEHPGPLYCIYTAARSFLTIIEDRTSPGHPIVSDEQLPADDVHRTNSRISILRCKNYLDFLLTVFNIVRPRMFLAECFYDKIYNDLLHAHVGRTAANGFDDLSEEQHDDEELPPEIARGECEFGPVRGQMMFSKRMKKTKHKVVPILEDGSDNEAIMEGEDSDKQQAMKSFWGAVKKLWKTHEETQAELSSSDTPASESSSVGNSTAFSSVSTSTTPSTSPNPTTLLNKPTANHNGSSIGATPLAQAQESISIPTQGDTEKFPATVGTSAAAPSVAAPPGNDSQSNSLATTTEKIKAGLPSKKANKQVESFMRHTFGLEHRSFLKNSTYSNVRAKIGAPSSVPDASDGSDSPSQTRALFTNNIPFHTPPADSPVMESPLAFNTPPISQSQPATAFPSTSVTALDTTYSFTNMNTDDITVLPSLLSSYLTTNQNIPPPHPPAQPTSRQQVMTTAQQSTMSSTVSSDPFEPAAGFSFQQKYPDYLEWSSEMNFDLVIQEIMGNSGSSGSSSSASGNSSSSQPLTAQPQSVPVPNIHPNPPLSSVFLGQSSSNPPTAVPVVPAVPIVPIMPTGAMVPGDLQPLSVRQPSLQSEFYAGIRGEPPHDRSESNGPRSSSS